MPDGTGVSDGPGVSGDSGDSGASDGTATGEETAEFAGLCEGLGGDTEVLLLCPPGPLAVAEGVTVF